MTNEQKATLLQSFKTTVLDSFNEDIYYQMKDYLTDGGYADEAIEFYDDETMREEAMDYLLKEMGNQSLEWVADKP